MNKKFLKRNFGILLILVLFATAGCQILAFAPPEQALQDRVSAMMTARVNEDWRTVYQYLEPDYREQVSEDKFAGMARNIFFSNFSIDSLDIAPSGKEADVVVKYDMSVMQFDVPGHSEKQKWIRHGRWYFQIKTDMPMGLD